MSVVLHRITFVLALLAVLVASPAVAQADACRVIVRVSDNLYFKPAEIQVPQHCEQLTVVLRHDGWLPKSATPRNWVLTRAADANAVASEGYLAGKDAGWLKPGDPRVIAHSAVIGRDEIEEVVVEIDSLEPQTPYTYLCTIPGLSPVMRGAFLIKNQD